ncbi:M13 family metallopeptidase [Rhodococcus aerolatus]
MPTAASGLDLTHVDPATRAQDDLFGHVNGRWLTEHQIPADRAQDGAFHVLRDRAEAHVREIVEECAAADPEPGTDAQRIGDLYASFLDEAAVDALGAGPIAGDLAAVAAATDPTELALVVARLQREGLKGVVGPSVAPDAGDPTRYLVHLSQSGLGLPDEAYYRAPEHAETLGTYRGHVARLLALGGVAGDPDALADSVLAVETRLARAHWDNVANRDAGATYNLRTTDDLVAAAPGFPWVAWADALGDGRRDPATVLGEVVVRQPSFVETLGRLWSGDEALPLADWQAWASWRVVAGRAPYLHAELVAANFDFVGRVLSGTTENRERWKRGVSLVEGLLGEAVGSLYVERHFPARSKERMVTLVANLVEAYRRRISTLDWMTPDTRERALSKLDAFTPKIGYPDRWRDYSAVTVTRGDLVGSIRAAEAADTDRELGRLGGPVDRDEWLMTPQTVNAYYNPRMNEIVFPAAILQPPFFDADADDAANYGGIGAVIGHEIGHGFDDQGSKYDGTGALRDWWSDADRTEFDRRTGALVSQYSVLEARETPGHPVNGALTVGENIGDLGGLSIALVAYGVALEAAGTEAPEIDGLTALQRVFFAWAQVWRAKTRPSEALRRLAVDPHSPPELRTNAVVRNIDAFHEAFDVHEGDGLWLDPAERVRIW